MLASSLFVGKQLIRKVDSSPAEIAKQQHVTADKWFVVSEHDYGRWYFSEEVVRDFDEVIENTGD